MAQRYVNTQRPTLAERVLASLFTDPDESIASTAIANYCQLLIDSGWQHQAHQLAHQELLPRFQDQSITLFQGTTATGQELVDQWFTDRRSPSWWEQPYGGFEVKAAGPEPSPLQNVYTLALDQRAGSEPAPQSLQFLIDQQRSQLIVFDPQGNEVGRTEYRPAGSARQIFTNDSLRPKYSLHGHLMVLGASHDLAVIDLFRLLAGEDSLLWHTSFTYPKNNDRHSLRRRFIPKRIENQLGSRIRHGRPRGRRIGAFGCDGQRVFYQKEEELICADLISGEVIWRRTQTSPNIHLLQQDDRLAVVSISLERRQRCEQATILDVHTGNAIKEIDLRERPLRSVWRTTDLKLVLSEYSKNRQTIEVFDLATEQTVWQADYPAWYSRFAERSPNAHCLFRAANRVR